MFNLTNKIQTLLVWLWTAYVLPALNLLKTKIGQVEAAVAGKVDTTTYNQYVTTTNLALNQTGEAINTLTGTTEAHTEVIQQLDDAVANLQNTTVTSSTFNQYASNTNGQISQMNGNLVQLQTQVNSGFVKEVPLSETLSNGILSVTAGQLEGHFMANGRYTVFVDENTELVGAAGEGVVTVNVEGTEYILDENDELSIVIGANSTITSHRKMQRASFAFDEDAVKAAVTAELQLHGFTL